MSADPYADTEQGHPAEAGVSREWPAGLNEESTRPGASYAQTLAVLAYLALTTLLLYSIFSEWGYDDPFITYRYAHNVAQGQGFVYNPGEQIQSTTTPLFTLLLALLYPLWSDLPHLANLIGAFSLALGAIFLWDLARTWETPLVGWSGLILYPSFPLLLSTLGSETPLYLALCLGAFAAYARQRYTLTAICSALATLARPDGILVPVILALHYLVVWFRQRNAVGAPAVRPGWKGLPWGGIAVFIAICLPWFVFAWLYFGAPLPVTLVAKQQQGAMSISQRFAGGFISLAGAYAQLWQYKLAGLLAVLGSIFMFWRARRWLLFLSWTALYFWAYSLLGVSRYFWYYAPLVPGFIALVGLGISAVTQVMERITSGRSVGEHIDGSPQQTPRWLQWAVVTSLLLLLAVGQAGDLQRLAQNLDPRTTIYRDAGLWLQENTPESTKIGALEIGIIGYYAQRPVIDFAGLIQPQTAAQFNRDTTYDGVAEWASQRYQPDYLILQAGLFPQLEAGYAAQYCRIVYQIPGDPYHYQHNLDVYTCQSKKPLP